MYRLMLLVVVLVLPANLFAKSPKSKKIRVDVIENVEFCQRVSDSLMVYGNDMGYSKGKSQIYSTNATSAIISNLRKGSTNEYINTKHLSFSQTNVDQKEELYLHLAQLAGKGFSSQKPILLGFNANELRFIPQTQQGTEIVLVVKHAHGLNARRAKAVVAAAKRAKIQVSVMWVGPNQMGSKIPHRAKSLAFVSALTGGKFVDLGGKTNPCGNIY